jgi:hypothetical protein
VWLDPSVLFGVGLAGPLGTLAVLTNFNHYLRLWDWPPVDGVPLYVARLILFAELLGLWLLWLAGTLSGLSLWRDHLVNKVHEMKIIVGMVAMSVAVGTLLAFPHWVVFITGFCTLYFLFNYWTQWLCNRHFERALTVTVEQPRMNHQWRKVLKAMSDFWLGRPQRGRIVAMMFVSSIAFSLAFAGYCLEDHYQKAHHMTVRSARLELAAYVLLILDILVGEIVVAVWRVRLHNDYVQAAQLKD